MVRHNGGSGGIYFHTTNTHNIGNDEREKCKTKDMHHSSEAISQTSDRRNTGRDDRGIFRATDTGHIDRGISRKNVPDQHTTNDADLLDPGEESLSFDSEVVISHTSRNVRNLSIKLTPNEFMKNRDINSHHTKIEIENEVTLASKPASHNPRRPFTNPVSMKTGNHRSYKSVSNSLAGFELV